MALEYGYGTDIIAGNGRERFIGIGMDAFPKIMGSPWIYGKVRLELGKKIDKKRQFVKLL